ncbi:hypothetical protein BpHYR1_050566 [Brachionus plicatilis]|uniref:Uncharacterized protein n=1 Tax=Brachionus plicatilis TaxID=10195 RepID=A0A3M7PBL6_BRAPC|nr:hypothetical protein BpHYR1_050566 [Brachionus plicatilis]
MSLRGRIHGFTAWANMRLVPFEHSLGNILMDLLNGTNMKYFLQSFTGKNNEKFTSFDSMTKEQIQTRVKWMLNELKEHKIIANDIILDTRLFAIRSSKHIFDLLWKLVCYDIYFLWIRIDFLSNKNEENLIRVPFTWVPESPPEKKNTKNPEISQLSGFGFIQDVLREGDKEEAEDTIDVNFPGLDFMKSFSLRKIDLHKVPNPKNCIIEMINIQLKTVTEGEQIVFTLHINDACQ